MWSNPDTKPDAEIAVDSQDPACGPNTASQGEASEPGGQGDHPSAHKFHLRPEVRELRNETAAISHQRIDMQNGIDESEAKQPSIQSQLLDTSIVTETGGAQT
jgi:hypothetical protein